jgi:hypothetical protein
VGGEFGVGDASTGGDVAADADGDEDVIIMVPPPQSPVPDATADGPDEASSGDGGSTDEGTSHDATTGDGPNAPAGDARSDVTAGDGTAADATPADATVGDAMAGDATAGDAQGDAGLDGASGDASATETGTGCPSSAPILCSGSCVDPTTSDMFCGATGSCTGYSSCSPDQHCAGGQCVCNAGLVLCGGTCIDPTTDNTHCGASGTCSGASQGKVCSPPQVCSGGSCVLKCAAGLMACGTVCVDPLSDPNYCGATTCSKNPCSSGQVCYAGMCQASCPLRWLECAGGCVLPDYNQLYCGSSGNCQTADVGVQCQAGQVCSGGYCSTTCMPPAELCGGTCADKSNDPFNCGFCGNKCYLGQHLCVQGACQ